MQHVSAKDLKSGGLEHSCRAGAAVQSAHKANFAEPLRHQLLLVSMCSCVLHHRHSLTCMAKCLAVPDTVAYSTSTRRRRRRTLRRSLPTSRATYGFRAQLVNTPLTCRGPFQAVRYRFQPGEYLWAGACLSACCLWQLEGQRLRMLISGDHHQENRGACLPVCRSYWGGHLGTHG